MWYLLCLEIMHSHWMSALLLQQVAAFLLFLYSDWLSGLQWFGEEGGLGGLQIFKWPQIVL